MTSLEKAGEILRRFKGDRYANGFGVLAQAGPMAAQLGKRAVLVCDRFPGSESHVRTIADSLAAAGVEMAGVVEGAAPNAPLGDLARMRADLVRLNPGVIVSFGGGSTIDCAKAAEVLRTLGGAIEEYFGVGLVTAKLQATGKDAHAAPGHSNRRQFERAPDQVLEHHRSRGRTEEADRGRRDRARARDVRLLGDRRRAGLADRRRRAGRGLRTRSRCSTARWASRTTTRWPRWRGPASDWWSKYLPAVLANPRDLEARQALGLATDLGGYAIMLGGTNGAHLTSFSLVDILSHGRACAIHEPLLHRLLRARDSGTAASWWRRCAWKTGAPRRPS